jgi:ribosomal protein S18 acetylase RimI-like enzyme
MNCKTVPDNPIIRQASLGDIDQLMNLVCDCIEGMRGAGIDQWDEAYPDRQTILTDIRGQTAHVATVDSGLLGMVVLNERQEPEYADVTWEGRGRAAVVHRLMVAPQWQSQGVGRMLMQFAEQRAATLGYACIRLDAFCGNPRAIHFYELTGYRRAGRVRFRKGLFDCFEKSLLAG